VAVRIRLQRMGKKKLPIYKIVAADSRARRDGAFLEAVGLYNPGTDPMTVDLKEDKILRWLKNGALPTDTVRNLFSRKGLWLKWHLIRKNKDEATIALEMEKWQAMQTMKLQHEIDRKARRKSKKKAAAETTPEKAS
jgi:small subunit ribosomal protein S16